MIYFIEAIGTNRVKIGFTDGDVETRRRALQTGCPNELRLIAQLSGGQATETELHRVLADSRESGEWFRLDSTVRVFLWLLQEAVHPVSELDNRIGNVWTWLKHLRAQLYPGSDKPTGWVATPCRLDEIEARIESLEMTAGGLEPDLNVALDSIDFLKGRVFELCESVERIATGRHPAESVRSLAADCRA